MSYTELYCYSCAHWEWDKDTLVSGHCGIASVRCATAILNQHPTPPPRYLSMEGVYEEPPDSEVSQET